MTAGTLVAALLMQAVASPSPVADHKAIPSTDPLTSEVAPAPLVPTLHISFVGGDVGKDIAERINLLSDQPDLLPVRQVILAAGETPCVLLVQQGFPASSCEHIKPTLVRLNPENVDPNNLQARTHYMLPDVEITRSLVSRTYDEEDPGERLKRLDLVSRWNKAIVKSVVKGGLRRVQFRAYDVDVAMPNDDSVRRGREALGPPNRNVIISATLRDPLQPARVFAASAEDYQAGCRADQTPPATYTYATRPADDPELQALIASQPAPAGVPDIWIIDTPVTAPPNLGGAVYGEDGKPIAPPPAASTWKCDWATFDSAKHHGTHMAGIIAARNGMGFNGLAPMARIRQMPWYAPDPNNPGALKPVQRRAADLAKLISLVENDVDSGRTARPIFLIATDFETAYGTSVSGGRLVDPSLRRNYAPANSFFDERPLVVVAAGQARPGKLPVRLDSASPMSPQNLGDLEGVVVVTACRICTREGVTMMEKVNVPGGAPAIVHVAAPGGEALPGWIDQGHVGAINGTSQAAAYAAGVLASMVARYPRAFERSRNAKIRLQATSWPIVDGVSNEVGSASKVATGVVDPQRALLDPSSDWINVAGRWTRSTIRSWSDGASILVEDASGTGVISSIPVDRLQRLVRVSKPGDPILFAVLTLGQPTGGSALGGEVGRLGPVLVGESAGTVTTCGATYKLSEVTEIILAMPRQGAPAC